MEMKVPSELKMAGNMAENWRKFHNQVKIYLKASGLDKKASDVKAAILLNIVGEEAIDIFETFDLVDEKKESFDDIVTAFEKYCTPKKNILYERHLFYNRKQEAGEKFDAFLTDIRRLAKSCEFGKQDETAIRDKIVFGIQDRSVQETLIKLGDPNLEKTTEVCRIAERNNEQVKQIQKGEVHSLYNKNKNLEKTVRNFSNKNNVNNNTNRKVGNTDDQKVCRKCNQRHEKLKCPAFGHRCKNCKCLHHFTKFCRSKKVYDIGETENDGDEYNYCIEAVHRISDVTNQGWYEKVLINNKSFRFKIDSGSDVNLLPMSLFEKINSSANSCIRKNSTILEAYGGTRIPTFGSVNLEINFKEKMFKEEFILVGSNSTPILGLKCCIKLGIIKQIHSVEKEKEKFIDENKEIFEGLGEFPDKLTIHLKENVNPVSKAARRIPVKIREKTKEKLSQLERLGIIEPLVEATDWVSNLVVVEKPDNTVRLCLDPRALNQAIKREHYMIPTLDDLMIKLSGVKFFTVFDLKDGFYQIKLTEESSNLCAFSTPFGCYKFKRLPFGINNAPEVFQKLNERNFGNLEGVYIYIDDLLITGKTELEHDTNLKKFLEQSKKLNVKFNLSKLQFKVNRVKFLGHIFNKDGVSPDPERIKAITHMDNPNNKKELQRFLGMINYLRSFIPNMAEITEPLRRLLRNDIEFQWTDHQDKAILELKNKICNAPILKPFNASEKIIIQTDASKSGIGCVLLQNKCPVAYASRSLTDTEVNYAQVEKEMLAIVYACVKFHYYIYGRHIEVNTDHKPLVGVMRNEIHKVNCSRLRRMKIKLLIYELEVKYVPGKELHIADHLSRSYLHKESADEFKEFAEVVHSIDLSETRKSEFKRETKNDPVLSCLIKMYHESWPSDKKNVPEIIKHYFKFREEIYVDDELVFFGNRVMVPRSLIRDILKTLHESHIGMTKCKQRARNILYWPGMDTDIENFISKCRVCEKYLTSNTKEPLIPHEVPKYPFEKIGCDILYFGGRDYLVVVDYFSKWLEILPLQNKQSSEVIKNLKTIFATHGIPKIVISDNMPFSSFECLKFSREWNFEFKTSSPTYAQSNGQSEKAVHIAKNLIKKATEDDKDINYALLEYRNHPVANLGASPTQIAISRLTRTKVPVKNELLVSKVVKDIESKLHDNQIKTKFYYDKSSKPRQPFQPGQNVVYRHRKTWEPAKILEKHPSPRSYIIKNEENRILRRNSSHLRGSKNEPNFKANGTNGNSFSREDYDIRQNSPRPSLHLSPPNVADDTMRHSFENRTCITRTGRISKPPTYLRDYV